MRYSISKETKDSNYRYDPVHGENLLNPMRCSGVEILINNGAFTIKRTVQVQCFLYSIFRPGVIIEHNLFLIEENQFSNLTDFQ